MSNFDIGKGCWKQINLDLKIIADEFEILEIVTQANNYWKLGGVAFIINIRVERF